MSSFADLERSIQSNANQVEKLIGIMGNLNTQTEKAKKSTEDLTRMQKKLGIAFKEDGKLFNQAKVRVNKYGQEVTKTGEVMGNFNKRSSIMAQTIAKFTKEGKTTPFLKGLSVYLKQGGNSLEYMAEYLTSSREELTIFGGEAKKMRKIFYGFFPPGMFKLFNKLSFTLQFVGGTYRKLGDSTIGASKELQKFKDILKDMDGSEEEFEGIKDIIAELEKEANPNIFTKMLGGFKKAAKFMSKPINPRIDITEIQKQMIKLQDESHDDLEAKARLKDLEGLLVNSEKVLKKNSFANLFFTKGQLKRNLKKEMSILKIALKSPMRKIQDNFALKLTGTKKQRLKNLKEALKQAKKFDISKVSKVDVRKKQKDMGIGAGVDDTKVKELTKAFEALQIETAIAEQKANKLQKSYDAGNTSNWYKLSEAQRELNKLKDEEIDMHDELDIAQKQYMNNLTSVASLADAQTALIQENKDLIVSSEAEISKIRKQGLQGYRKRLVDLGSAYKEHNQQFTEGTDKYDKAIEKTQKIIDNIDVSKIQNEMQRLGDTAEDRAKRETELQEKIANYKPKINANKIDTTAKELELMQTQLAAIEKVKGREEELNKLLETRENALKKVEDFKTRSKGIQALKDEIKLTKDTIKVNKEKLAGTEKIIKASEKQIKQSEKAKKKLTKDFEAKRDAAESIPEQIKIMQELDVKLAEEDDKISKAESDKKQAEGNMEVAIQDIDEGQVSLDNSQEQLDTLKDLKSEATKKLLQKFPMLGKVFKFVKLLKGLPKLLMSALRMFMMGFIYISLAILGLLVVVKLIAPIIAEVWGNILAWLQPAFQVISGAIALIYSGFQLLFSAFFGDGTFADAVDGLLEIAFGLLQLLLGLALASLSLGFALLVEVGKVLWQKAVDYVLDMFTSVKKFTKGIVVLVAIVGTIVAMILGAPVWLAIVIGLVIWRVGQKLIDPVVKVIKYIRKKVSGIISAIKSINPFADGGVTTKGLSLVGEKGPELVNLPKGTRVHSNKESRTMIASSGQRGGTVNNINITVNAKDTSKAEMDRIAREISRSITNNISRQSNTNNLR